MYRAALMVILVAGMLAVGERQSAAQTPERAPAASPGEQPAAEALDGKQLFRRQCAMCHRPPRPMGRSVPAIRRAIRMMPQMRYLDGRISDAELKAIADYLTGR